MSGINAWLDPRACPAQPPPLQAMAATTQSLHEALDAHTRASGRPYLHPTKPSLQLDLFGSPDVIAWQEGKAALLFEAEGCWSELPHLYARYGTDDGRTLIGALKALHAAQAVLLADCGMQAVALTADVLLGPGSHAICLRQVYNKSRTFLEKQTVRLGGSCAIVDDASWEALEPQLDAALRPETALLFAEALTNPLLRVQDIAALVAWTRKARAVAPNLQLVVDDTISTPWGHRQPLLTQGVDVVVGSGTKALGGEDSDLWGYIATRHIDLANAIMDLQALRGGGLDGARARSVLQSLPLASERHAQRCASAVQVAAFLANHPAVEAVFHPSRPDHPDAAVASRDLLRCGSLLSFRLRGASESEHRRLADALATTHIVRYALSFDGLCTKVNHHPTVSEYFTPPPVLKKLGCDRLIRLGVGLEDPADLCACLNWALQHGRELSTDALQTWQDERKRALGLPTGSAGWVGKRMTGA